jgi:hypothetical protein
MLNADQHQLIELNNAYAINCNLYGDEIFANDEEFFEMFYPKAGDGLNVAKAVCFGDYKYHDDWVTFDGYGNLKSYSYIDIDKLCEMAETIAEYVEENFEEFDYLEIFSNIKLLRN